MKMTFKQLATLIGTGIAGILVAVDFTIVNTALPNIQSGIGASISELQWVMAGFGITFCTFLASMGRFADIIGRRKLLYIGMAGFVLASIGAAFSSLPVELIFFRIIQGAFGAIIFPAGMAIVAQTFTKEHQGKMLGIYGSFIGIGLAVGPVLGGLILSFANWSWIFLINVPVILTSYFFCFISVSESKLSVKIPIDWAGMALITVCLGTLVFALNEGGNFGWGSPLIIALFVIAIITGTIFYRVEKKSPAPLLPLELISNHSFLIASLVYIAGVSFAWVILFLAPLYLQNVVDLTPSATGWVLFSLTLMTFVMPTFSGQALDKKGAMPVISVMFLILAISYILQLFFQPHGPIILIVIAYFLYGTGWGICNGIATPIALVQLKNVEDAGTVSGALITVLNVVAVLSLIILGGIFRYSEKLNLGYLMQKSSIALPADHENMIRSLLSEPEKAKTILASLGQSDISQVISLFRAAFLHGYQTVIIILLILTLLIYCFIYWSQRHKNL